MAQSDQPDLILIDVTMPEHSGYDLCRSLKADPDTFHIPVVMITAAKMMEQRILGLEAGADDFLSKPFDDLTLVARVRSLMRVKITYDEMRLRDDTSRELGLHRLPMEIAIQTGRVSFRPMQGSVCMWPSGKLQQSKRPMRSRPTF